VLSVEPDAIDFNRSENRSRFVFVNGFGSRGFGDAALIGYDTKARLATSYGTLPGTADFGTDYVFASTVGGPGSFLAGFAARSVNGVVQDSDAKVFSFDVGNASSLQYTTSKQ